MMHHDISVSMQQYCVILSKYSDILLWWQRCIWVLCEQFITIHEVQHQIQCQRITFMGPSARIFSTLLIYVWDWTSLQPAQKFCCWQLSCDPQYQKCIKSAGIRGAGIAERVSALDWLSLRYAAIITLPVSNPGLCP